MTLELITSLKEGAAILAARALNGDDDDDDEEVFIVGDASRT